MPKKSTNLGVEAVFKWFKSFCKQAEIDRKCAICKSYPKVNTKEGINDYCIWCIRKYYGTGTTPPMKYQCPKECCKE